MTNWLAIILSCLLGLSPGDQAPPCRVVTSIEILCDHGLEQDYRLYTGQEAMEEFLFYLRRLDPVHSPGTIATPEPGTVYRITLSFSDGSTQCYEQLQYNYLSVDGGPWLEIDSEDGLLLPFLIAVLPSD